MVSPVVEERNLPALIICGPRDRPASYDIRYGLLMSEDVGVLLEESVKDASCRADSVSPLLDFIATKSFQ